MRVHDEPGGPRYGSPYAEEGTDAHVAGVLPHLRARTPGPVRRPHRLVDRQALELNREILVHRLP